MQKKPLLVIVSEKTRDHFHRPLRYFTGFRIIHLYSSVYPDSTLQAQGVETIVYRSPWQLYQLLKKLKPDYLQGMEPYYGYSRIKISSKAIWRLITVRSYVGRYKPIFFFHVLENIAPERKYGLVLGRLMRWLFRWYAQPAHVVFYANGGAKQNCLAAGVEGWRLKKSCWGFWGVDTKLFTPSQKTLEPSLLFVGSLTKQKGIQDFLAIADTINQTMPNLVMTIIGDGPTRKYVQNAIDRNPNWRWHSMVKYSDLPRIITRYWLMVSPSYDLPWSSEQVGMANLEALSCGTPVIAYRSGSINEFLPNNSAVSLVASGDRRVLVRHVQRYLRDGQLRSKASIQAREWVDRQFNDQKNCAEIEQWFFPKKPGVIFTKATHSIGGGEVQTLDLADGLSKQGIAVTVVTNDDSPLIDRLGNHELRINDDIFDLGPEAVSRWPIAQLFLRLPILRRKAKQLLNKLYLQGYRTIVCQSINEKLVFTPVASELGMKVFWFDLQSLLPWMPKNPLFRLLKKALKDVDRVVTSSKFLASELELMYGRPVEVVYPGIEFKKKSEFRNPKAETNSDGQISKFKRIFTIGTVGRLHEEKGIDVFLRALALLPENYHGVIVGDGPARVELEALIGRLNLQSRAKLVGFQKDPGRFYEHFDLFCQPSRRDNAPLTLVEAMAHGVPVVASNVGGIPELVGDAGILFESENADELARSIQAALVDEKRYQVLSRKAFTHVKKFSRERMVKSFVKTIHSPSSA